ncbi:MAG: flagellar hook-length control protein FliK [Burkholderiales bacterium]|nr:flagellar hook-length control protein FliK [Burkholderiales bacterium]OJX09091.1 MAG: hypothetical protein BGO72_19500 [Burkholderiales bacterium 70-64]
MKSDSLLLQAGGSAAPTPSRPPRGAQGSDERAPFGDTIARALRQAGAQDAPPGASSGPKADAGEEQAATKGDASPERGDETAAPAGDKSPTATAAAAAPVPAAAPACAPVALPACVPAGASTTTEPASDRAAPEAAGETAAVDAQTGPAHAGQPGQAGRTRPGGALPAASDRATHAAATGGDPAADASPVAATGTQDAREPRTEHPGARAASEFAAHLAQARGTADANAAQALAAGLNVRGAAPDGAAAPVSIPSSTLSTPVGSPAFPSHLAAEVATIGLAGVERAEIELRPRELGPVRVELSMSGESARIAFSAAHPDTRQAIEQTLPILKDMLAERGLMLAGASVSDGGAGSGRTATGDGPPRRYDGPALEGGTALDAPGPRPSTTARRTLLDVYA